MNEFLEKLASHMHDAWRTWTNGLVSRGAVDDSTIERWKPLWVPYEQLSEEEKEKDRVFAREIIKTINDSYLIPDDAYCLSHPHCNRLEEAVCSLYFQLHNAKALILKQERTLAEFRASIPFSVVDRRNNCGCSKCL